MTKKMEMEIMDRGKGSDNDDPFHNLKMLAHVACVMSSKEKSPPPPPPPPPSLRLHDSSNNNNNNSNNVDVLVLSERERTTFKGRRVSSNLTALFPSMRPSDQNTTTTTITTNDKQHHNCIKNNINHSNSNSKPKPPSQKGKIIHDNAEEHQNTQSSSSSSRPAKITLLDPESLPKSPPDDMLALILANGGSDLKLLTRKEIFNTDLSPNHGRLQIPFSQVVAHDFLTQEEARLIRKKEEEEEKEGDRDIRVSLIDPCLDTIQDISFRMWRMKNNSAHYVFCSKWNSVVKKNSFNKGDIIQMWSFRNAGNLCFALVKENNHIRDDDASSTSATTSNPKTTTVTTETK